ncbi:MAG: DUF3825 domain-containing protein [Bacilli bacterium]|jgi:hypothetical protein|nr:DUF3825 domain-containing protein [Bacilli bacterium]
MQNLEKYLIENETLPKIKKFANLGGKELFNKKLKYLVNLAEEEKWNQTDIHTNEENSTIFYYILHTFDRCFDQNKIFITEDETNAYFNTGLMTKKGEEIIGKFIRNNFHDPYDVNSNYWFFKEFILDNSRSFMDECNIKLEIATYFDDFNELYFNPNLDIVINFEHIYKDNYERLPNELQSMEIEIAKYVFEGYLNFTKKKIMRNNRIPVPQFYKNKIMFLIPVRVFDSKTIVIALEKINDTYRGNTILSVGMAYNCARLLYKPESDWLLNSFIK